MMAQLILTPQATHCYWTVCLSCMKFLLPDLWQQLWTVSSFPQWMRNSPQRTCGSCYEIYPLETVTFLSWCPAGSLLYDPLCEENNKQERLTGPWPHHSFHPLCLDSNTIQKLESEKKNYIFWCFTSVLSSCFWFKNTRKISLPVLPLKVSPFSKLKNFFFRDTDLAAFHCMGRLI